MDQVIGQGVCRDSKIHSSANHVQKLVVENPESTQTIQGRGILMKIWSAPQAYCKVTYQRGDTEAQWLWFLHALRVWAP